MADVLLTKQGSFDGASPIYVKNELNSSNSVSGNFIFDSISLGFICKSIESLLGYLLNFGELRNWFLVVLAVGDRTLSILDFGSSSYILSSSL